MNGIYWYNCIDKSKKHKGNLWMIAVVPRAGTWIETWDPSGISIKSGVSFPMRERGLKYGKVMGQQVGHTSCSFPCGDID